MRSNIEMNSVAQPPSAVSGGPGPLDLGESMICAQRHAHDHRVPHLQRRWARRALARAVIGASVLFATGCQLMVNPFRDELAGRQEMTTASVEGARAAKTTPTVRQRDYAPFELHAENMGVTHGPLYFEDSSEDKGSEDGRFAWTGED